MVMSKKEAKKLGFRFTYYNPYSTIKDRHFFGVLFVIVLVSLIVGLRYFPKLFLIINSAIALSLSIVVLIDMITSEKI